MCITHFFPSTYCTMFHIRTSSVLSTPCEETLQRFKSMRNCSESFPQWSKNHLYEILNGSLDADGIMIIQVENPKFLVQIRLFLILYSAIKISRLLRDYFFFVENA